MTIINVERGKAIESKISGAVDHLGSDGPSVRRTEEGWRPKGGSARETWQGREGGKEAGKPRPGSSDQDLRSEI